MPGAPISGVLAPSSDASKVLWVLHVPQPLKTWGIYGASSKADIMHFDFEVYIWLGVIRVGRVRELSALRWMQSALTEGTSKDHSAVNADVWKWQTTPKPTFRARDSVPFCGLCLGLQSAKSEISWMNKSLELGMMSE